MIRKIRKFLFGSKLIRCVSNPKSTLQEKWWDVLDYGYSLYTDLIVVSYESLCRFFYWGWKFRKHYEWEFEFGYYLYVYLKLKKFIKYCEEYGHLQWNSNSNNTRMRKLRICCELAKRLHEDNYDANKKMYYEIYEPNWHEAPFRDFVNKKAFRRADKEYQLQQEHEKEYFWKLLKSNYQNWED
ncbi:MAG: hypothetical protein WC516_09675 [Patescibacteria group bacterium]|jgi:hypothetical protein